MTSQGGSSDLSALLLKMQPSLHESSFLFCTLGASATNRNLPDLPKDLDVQLLFKEAEGWTVVVEEQSAASTAKGIEGFETALKDETNRWRMITLKVHSSLLAVGFISAISTRFSEAEIPSNVVAGYYHDHIFVPQDKSEEAMNLLAAITRAE